ncbi:lipoprotein [Klebsiella pneumoniae]|uniref:Lipoprotein n=1 Tax=Klebsiella pneumoniae TaxID=573 RepID=A0A377ZAW0_KLEPN|nr:lipoprotein [Klebsiella pneumoniae]
MTLTDASVGKVTVQIGPTLRGTQLRDGYSGASYQDFNDQVLFGEYSKNINSQAVKMIQTANVKTGRQRGGVRRLLGLGYSANSPGNYPGENHSCRGTIIWRRTISSLPSPLSPK